MTAPMKDLLAEPEAAEAGEPAGAGGARARRAAAIPGRGQGLATAWRRSRGLLAVAAFVIAGLVVVVLLAPRPKSNIYLDPSGTNLEGTKALARILAERGSHVTAVYSAADALAATGMLQPGHAPTVTLVITSPSLLTAAERGRLAHADADLVLVEPHAATLRTLAPAVRVANSDAPLGDPVNPACALPGARLAGSANEGGITYRAPRGAISCYPIDGSPSVVIYRGADRSVTIAGSGLPFSNAWLALEGNAALALNLLSTRTSIVWLTPEPKLALVPPASRGRRPGPSLIPDAAWLVVLQLGVALLLAAIWRARRFGPLIPERLPVVVRASETAEGHARLYQSRRARDRAASALREDMLRRIQPALGLAHDAPPDAVADALASRSRRSRRDITAIVSGPLPATDTDLVRLADDLDDLEREVRSQ